MDPDDRSERHQRLTDGGYYLPGTVKLTDKGRALVALFTKREFEESNQEDYPPDHRTGSHGEA